MAHCNSKTMTQISVSIFAAYAPSLFNAYTSQTDALVWWFARQNDTVQNQVVDVICSNQKIRLSNIMDTFWGINSTFLPSWNVQNHMTGCIASVGSPANVSTFLTQNPWTGGSIFTWNPLTPRGYIWYNILPDTDQVFALNWLCYYSNHQIRLINRTIIYYQSGSSFYNTSVVQAMNRYQNMIPFVMGDFFSNSSKSWFLAQPYESQLLALIYTCKSSRYNANSLVNGFTYLLDGFDSVKIRTDTKSCVNTYKFTYRQQYNYYRPTDAESLVWLAAQNMTTQKQAILYICVGRAMNSNLTTYTTSQILKILETISSYLSNLNLITFTVVDSIDICSRYYAHLTIEKALKNLDSTTNVWLASQNSSTQTEFVNLVCYNQNLSALSVLQVFQTTAPVIPRLSWEVQSAMVFCPSIRSISINYFSYMYWFVGMGAFSALSLISLTIWITFEHVDSRKTDHSKATKIITSFNISLVICLVSTLFHDAAYAMVWFLSEVMFVTNISHSLEKQVYYVISEVCLACWATSYLVYCWIRSEMILKRVWGRLFPWIKRAFIFAPLTFLSPGIFQAVVTVTGMSETVELRAQLDTIQYTLQAVASSVLLLNDVLLLSAFTGYVAGLYELSSQFLIIARYGIGFSSLCFCFSALSIAKPFMKDQSIFFKIALSVLMHLVSFLLVLMKIHIYCFNKTEAAGNGAKDHIRNQIEQSKQRLAQFESQGKQHPAAMDKS
ncbi:hypothetical protein BCR33DRAFT_190384 [Rhizoclosmatium globosum]|uniref:Uncharacterized protein n=1 Tax=Rhizoclosmatium globosum TaxID=329046 RepID=A0A1Y2D1N5_9FUNG|nr:hypothetical protein BCR33DRAFT_190384 [Rhizoclosmatium globosum]|eukprot:ORY53201.1 hypothetical protein BCR33DRAFT_190384 [Rhizoclosmatium globosum]